ncbi:MAG: non-canonical purine NTP pyrophosphatase [Acidobacteriota bacterium]
MTQIDDGAAATRVAWPGPPFTLVTGNAGKAAEVARLLDDVDGPPRAAIDLPELQSLDVDAVARAKLDAAWSQLGRTLVIDETSLELAALNGFPGPLIKWLLQSVGAAGLARLAAQLGDDRATARCVLLLCDGRRLWRGEGVVAARIVPPAGDGGFGWDAVVQPEDASGTYAALSAAEKDRIGHRGCAWRDLADAVAAGRSTTYP